MVGFSLQARCARGGFVRLYGFTNCHRIAPSVLRRVSCASLSSPRIQVRHVATHKFLKTDANVFSGTYVVSYLLGAFIFAMLYLNIYCVRDMVAETEKNNKTKKVSSAEKEQIQRRQDPRRPPWPVLHQRVVFMREGKQSHEDIGILWEQTKYYYSHDWLIPLEMAQILKYSSGVYLSAYVADPDALRREVIQQLEDVKYGRLLNATESKINRDVEEIITIAIDELENISLEVSTEVPLVPVMTKKGRANV